MDESIQHLFSHCSTAQAVRSIVAFAIGANNIPTSLHHCWVWCESWLPNGKQFHTFGIAAIYWASWKTRNAIWFEGIIVCSLSSIVSFASALIGY